jgi:hypothetical protein
VDAFRLVNFFFIVGKGICGDGDNSNLNLNLRSRSRTASCAAAAAATKKMMLNDDG